MKNKIVKEIIKRDLKKYRIPILTQNCKRAKTLIYTVSKKMNLEFFASFVLLNKEQKQFYKVPYYKFIYIDKLYFKNFAKYAYVMMHELGHAHYAHKGKLHTGQEYEAEMFAFLKCLGIYRHKNISNKFKYDLFNYAINHIELVSDAAVPAYRSAAKKIIKSKEFKKLVTLRKELKDKE